MGVSLRNAINMGTLPDWWGAGGGSGFGGTIGKDEAEQKRVKDEVVGKIVNKIVSASNLSLDEVNSILDADTGATGQAAYDMSKQGTDIYEAIQLLRNDTDVNTAVDAFFQTVNSNSTYKKAVEPSVKSIVETRLGDEFGDADFSKLITDEDITSFIQAGTDINKRITDTIDTLRITKKTNLEAAYGAEFLKRVGRAPTGEELDQFTSRHMDDSLGLDGMGEVDPSLIRKSLDELTANISTELDETIAGDEDLSNEAGDNNLEDAEGMTADEISAGISKAQDKFASTLAESRGTLQDRLYNAFSELEAAIPERVEKYTGLLTERFKESTKELPKQLGEQFTALNAFKSGDFQKVLAEEYAEKQAGLESQIAEYQLGQEQQTAQQQFELEQQLAGIEASDKQRVAGLGMDIAQYGAGMQRDDFLNALNFQQQQQMMGQQQDINLYLNRLGYMQNQAMTGQQYQNQLGLLGQQQAFQSGQSALQRSFQERLYNQQMQQELKQQNDLRKALSKQNFGQALGGGIGTLFGGVLGKGQGAMMGGQAGSMFGGALFSG